jgi:hypothetical protein
LLSDVENAADTDTVHITTENLDRICAGIHVEIVIGQEYVSSGLNFDTPGVGIGSDNDLITIDECIQMGI